MSTSKEEKKLFSNDQVIRLLVTAFVIGGAWARLEYKMNETGERLLKRIDEHILADGFQKAALAERISAVEAKAKQYEAQIMEYLKPEDVKIKRK